MCSLRVAVSVVCHCVKIQPEFSNIRWAVVAQPSVPALGRQRQADLVSSGPAWAIRASFRTGSKATEKPCFEKKTNQPNKQTKIPPKYKHYPAGSVAFRTGYSLAGCPASRLWRVQSRCQLNGTVTPRFICWSGTEGFPFLHVKALASTS